MTNDPSYSAEKKTAWSMGMRLDETQHPNYWEEKIVVDDHALIEPALCVYMEIACSLEIFKLLIM